MDPKDNIREQIQLATSILAQSEVMDWDTNPPSPKLNPYDCTRLAELVLALDEWQSKGGFSPYIQGWK